MESSYCYMAKDGKAAKSINETIDLELTQDTHDSSRSNQNETKHVSDSEEEESGEFEDEIEETSEESDEDSEEESDDTEEESQDEEETEIEESYTKSKLQKTSSTVNKTTVEDESEEQIKTLNCQIEKLNEKLSSKIGSAGTNDRSNKHKLSHSGFEDANLLSKEQKSIFSAGINTSIQTEIVKKKSIGTDADNELLAKENENLRNELKNQMDKFRQLESESRQIQNELRSQLKMVEVDSQSQLNEKEILLSESNQQIVKLQDKISILEAEAKENYKIVDDYDSKFLKLRSDSESEIKRLKDKSEEYTNELEAKKLAFERLEESNVQIQLPLTLNKIKDDNDKNLNTQVEEKPKKVTRKKWAI